MAELKLLPCKCGKTVEVKYLWGILGKDLLSVSRSPQYYISCECGNEMSIDIVAITDRQRNKCKRELIMSWNAQNKGKR